jgi:hypothetical protein
MKLHGPQSDRNRLWAGQVDLQRRDITSQKEVEQVFCFSRLFFSP